ncbi:MAG: hypothetical protein KGQ87_07410 [Verrucomicrobia bacterium]|nr:hypothetical protein [Verrucomicrobiota bacterium]
MWLASRALRGSHCLFLICLIFPAKGPVWGFEYSKGAIHPGMVLNGVAIPLSLAAKNEPIVLFASVAKTLDQAHLLHLEEVNSVFSVRLGNSSSIRAKTAVFDFLKKEIVSLHETDLILDVSNPRNISHELLIDGSVTDKMSHQSKDPESRLSVMMGSGVDADGYLFVQVKSFQTRSPLLEKANTQAGIDSLLTFDEKSDSILLRAPSRLNLVQEACGSLSHFYKCWPLADGQREGYMGCFSKNGGRLADLEKGVTINGPSVLLSKPIVLNASEGIFLRRGLSDDHEEMETHVSANNGVKAVLSGEKGEIAIECRSFKQVVERKAAQFEGGPVVMRRNQVILVAEEEWQFVRIFDYHRVVLSPGKWQMIGALEPGEASSYR